MSHYTKPGFERCVACGAEVERALWVLQAERCGTCCKQPAVYLRCQGCGQAFDPSDAREKLLDEFCIRCWKRAALEARCA